MFDAGVALESRLDANMEGYERDCGVDEEYLRAVGYAGRLLESNGRYPHAAEVYRRIIKLGEACGNVAAVTTAHACMGMTLSRLGRYEEAIEQLEEACRIGGDQRDRSKLAYAHWMRGNVLAEHGRSEEAEKNFQTFLQISRELGDRQRIAIGTSSNGSSTSHCAAIDRCWRSVGRRPTSVESPARSEASASFTMRDSKMAPRCVAWKSS